MCSLPRLRPPLPGEVWRISVLEGHCLFELFIELEPFFDPQRDRSFWNFHYTLKEIEKTFRRDGVHDGQTHLEVAPTDYDRVFFETLIKVELTYLCGLDDEMTRCEDCGEPLQLPCGHTFKDHEEVLRSWLEREIEQPKEFALSRDCLRGLSPAEQLLGKRTLSRQDAEKIISQELERLRIHLITMNMSTLEESDKAPPYPDYSRKDLAQTLERTTEVTLKDAERQLRANIEPLIIDA